MMRQKYFIIGLVIISVFYLGTRLYRLPELMTFGLDQGLYMSESYQMWQEKKIRLVGPAMISRNYQGRNFFIGPYFYYVLVLLGVLTKWEPLVITVIILLMEWIFWIIFGWWVGKKYGATAALGILAVVASNEYLIIHSRFIWNPHFLAPLAILAVIFLESKRLFIFSFVWGLAFSFHQTAILWLIPLVIALKEKMLKIKNFLVLATGFILGDILYFIFEIKHDFYNFKTIWLIFSQGEKGGVEPHHLVFPIVVFALWGLAKLIKINKKWLAGAILINLVSLWVVRYDLPLGHPKGWTYAEEKAVVKKILENGCPKNYNVASTLSGDTRSADLRYLLTKSSCLPMGVEDFPKAERLFLVAPPERRLEEERVWEVDSFRPFKILREEKINERVVFYELSKGGLVEE